MPGVILALVARPDVAPRTLAACRGLAGLMGGARINVLAIRQPPDSTILPTEEILTRHQTQEIRGREEARVAALRAAFDAWVETARGPAIAIEWTDIEGMADSLVTEWGRRADFIVLNRPARADRGSDRLEMQAALFDTDRPVLVVPGRHAVLPPLPIGECVAIAWRDDKRTVRAVLAALRLLSHAREVHVLAGLREGTPEPGLPAILAEHGIQAKLHVLPLGPPLGPEAHLNKAAGAFGETLLAAAHQVGADMLVMGAYTHNRWREMVLGGVTQYMLSRADLPVLMRH